MSYFYKIQKISESEFSNHGGTPVKADEALDVYKAFRKQHPNTAKQHPTADTDVFSLTFSDENDHSLTIVPGGEGCFNVVYENKTQYADLMLSNDINENPENISPEDYIVWFFNSEIEKRLSPEAFSEKPDDSNDEKTLSFGPRNKSFYYCMLPSAYFIFASAIVFSSFIIGAIDVETAFIPLLITILVFSLSIPSFVLWFNYSCVNRNATFHIRKNDNQFLYCDRNRQTEFNAKDIKTILHVYPGNSSFRTPWYAFEYLEINLKNEEPIYITCFMAEISDITFSLDLKHKTRNESFPKIKK